MHLVAFVENPDHVCARYRLRAIAPMLLSAGHTLQYHVRPGGWWRWFTQPMPPADGCVIQRRLLNGWELRRLRRTYPFLAFDFDDAIWLRDSYARKGLHSRRRLARFRATLEAVDAVFAGNSFLADHAAQYTPTDRIRLIPTCIEPRQYPPAEHVLAGAGVRLAWIGSSSTLRGLEQFAPVLERIGQVMPGVHLKLICDRPLRLSRLHVEMCPWSAETEAAQVSSADIGITWMPDDDWSRGKCGLKALQYMAAGLPVIANPVGLHQDLVRHGVNGFLASTTNEWLNAVQTLTNDPAMRRRLGRAGRERVERDFSVARSARLWLDALGSTAMQRRAA